MITTPNMMDQTPGTYLSKNHLKTQMHEHELSIYPGKHQ
jgi:hypothetical protein